MLALSFCALRETRKCVRRHGVALAFRRRLPLAQQLGPRQSPVYGQVALFRGQVSFAQAATFLLAERFAFVFACLSLAPRKDTARLICRSGKALRWEPVGVAKEAVFPEVVVSIVLEWLREPLEAMFRARRSAWVLSLAATGYVAQVMG